MSHENSSAPRRGPDQATSDAMADETRRGFMFKIGAGIMTLGGLVIAAPVVGYIFAPAVKNWKKRRSWELPLVLGASWLRILKPLRAATSQPR